MTPDTPGNEPRQIRSKPKQGAPTAGSTSEIQDAYLRRSIAEIEALNRDILACRHCEPKDELPVLASGSPQAEIMMVKWSASLAERQEGVAFFGRAGTAILKSVQRLGIDPMTMYGTLAIKCSHLAESDAAELCPPWLGEEIAIVMPKLVVPMGARALGAINRLEYPLAEPLSEQPGIVQRWTPTIEALYVPDIDESLDEQNAKRAFWAAFRAIGEWHEAQPPY
jgi:uracil-DNA glycosylase family 4